MNRLKSPHSLQTTAITHASVSNPRNPARPTSPGSSEMSSLTLPQLQTVTSRLQSTFKITYDLLRNAKNTLQTTLAQQHQPTCLMIGSGSTPETSKLHAQ